MSMGQRLTVLEAILDRLWAKISQSSFDLMAKGSIPKPTDSSVTISGGRSQAIRGGCRWSCGNSTAVSTCATIAPGLTLQRPAVQNVSFSFVIMLIVLYIRGRSKPKPTV